MQKKSVSCGWTLPSSISDKYYKIFNEKNIQWKHYSNVLTFFEECNKTKLTAASAIAEVTEEKLVEKSVKTVFYLIQYKNIYLNRSLAASCVFPMFT